MMLDRSQPTGWVALKRSNTTRVRAGASSAHTVGGGAGVVRRVGGGNVIGQRSVIGAVVIGFAGLLLRVGSRSAVGRFSDSGRCGRDSVGVSGCRGKIWAIPAMLSTGHAVTDARQETRSGVAVAAGCRIGAPGVSSPRRSSRRSVWDQSQSSSEGHRDAVHAAAPIAPGDLSTDQTTFLPTTFFALSWTKRGCDVL